jgi:AraC-like DNA-binding protein
LESIVRALLLDGYPSVRVVAGQMGIPVRTLQRRLREQGITYRELVDEFRFREACRYLDDTEDRVASIASALGYRDPSHFSRAFRRWSGMRPSDYRMSRRAWTR